MTNGKGARRGRPFSTSEEVCVNKTELLNKLARDNGERLLLARALDKLELARQRNIPACTGFLSPQERVSVENLLNACGHPRHLFFGGYEGAERTVCAFLPDWQEAEDWQGDGESCPVRACGAPGAAAKSLPTGISSDSILGLGLDLMAHQDGTHLAGQLVGQLSGSAEHLIGDAGNLSAGLLQADPYAILVRHTMLSLQSDDLLLNKLLDGDLCDLFRSPWINSPL